MAKLAPVMTSDGTANSIWILIPGGYSSSTNENAKKQHPEAERYGHAAFRNEADVFLDSSRFCCGVTKVSVASFPVAQNRISQKLPNTLLQQCQNLQGGTPTALLADIRMISSLNSAFPALVVLVTFFGYTSCAGKY